MFANVLDETYVHLCYNIVDTLTVLPVSSCQENHQTNMIPSSGYPLV